MLEVRCPKCATLLSAEKVSLGSKVGCKKCGQIFVLEANIQITAMLGGAAQSPLSGSAPGSAPRAPATDDVLILTDDGSTGAATPRSARDSSARTSTAENSSAPAPAEPDAGSACQWNRRSSCCPMGRCVVLVALLGAIFVGLTSLSRMCGRGGCPFSSRSHSACTRPYVTSAPGELPGARAMGSFPAEIVATASMTTHGCSADAAGAQHTEPVRSVALSASSKWVISGAQDGQLRVWLRDTGKFVAAVQSGHEPSNTLQSVAFTGPDTLVSAGGKDVRYWSLDTMTGRLRAVGSSLLGNSLLGNGVLAMSVHPNGKWLAVALSDSSIRILSATAPDSSELPMAEFVHTIKDAHKDAHGSRSVRALAFHPDGLSLASAGEDGSVRLWSVVGDASSDLRLDATAARVGRHEKPVDALAFDPAGKFLLAGDRSGLVKVWSARDLSSLGVLLPMTGGAVQSLAARTDGFVFGGLADGSLVVWKLPNLSDRAVRGTPTLAPIGPVLPAHAGGLNTLTLSTSTGDTLVTGGADNSVRIWSLPRLLPALEGAPLSVRSSKTVGPKSECCVEE